MWLPFLSITQKKEHLHTNTTIRTFIWSVAAGSLFFSFCVLITVLFGLFGVQCGSMFVMIPLNFQLTVYVYRQFAIIILTAVHRVSTHLKCDERHTIEACAFLCSVCTSCGYSRDPLPHSYTHRQPEYVPVESLHLIPIPN